jgi:hypothetical protein
MRSAALLAIIFLWCVGFFAGYTFCSAQYWSKPPKVVYQRVRVPGTPLPFPLEQAVCRAEDEAVGIAVKRMVGSR